MPRPKRIFRVAMTSDNAAANMHSTFLGVLRYSEQAENWVMVGQLQQPIQAFKEVDPGSVDGVVGFFRGLHTFEHFREAGVATVNFSNSIENLDMPRVGNDDEEIGRLAARHLLERGFTQFGFLGDDFHWYSRRRLAGFREVIEEDSRLGRQVHVISVSGQGDIEQLSRWLGPLPKPVGVMAINDWRAITLIQSAQQLGLRVPEDLAVVGVDNNPWLTQLSSPKLTSIEPDWERVGFEAARMLDELLRGETPAPSPWIKPLGMTQRGSTDILIAEDPVVGRSMAYIQKNYARPITVEHLLDEVGVSRRKLESRLKDALGVTPHQAICRARVERAKEMLVQTDSPMEPIARKCGFGSSNQLQIVFKRLTGMTPGQYRQRFGSR